jgi:hypothetical protein
MFVFFSGHSVVNKTHIGKHKISLREQKRLDEQRIKKNIFDPSIFKINNYNNLILGNYNLNDLINNLIYIDKYIFHENDNLKIKTFLDKLDISSNDINEENRKKLIDLLLIFVTNFIND